ncbi:MAG: patatin-like phospholipase family protein [Rikenellaceae bacterium]
MLRTLLSFITLISLTLSVQAQSVGVTMSGGGAKGLYHIGVLQALEEIGVPIESVSGTSMGAIVAGLYAAGYSPKEMYYIATSGELQKWVSGEIDNNYGAYFRESNRFRKTPSILSMRLDPKDPRKIVYMPESLISTAQVDMALSNYFAPASAVAKGDFSKLMVPFLCVASDVMERKGVVLKSGDLGEAIRSSMAIPVAYSPVRQSGMILYDGGMYDNFPWQPLREFYKPDIIIGSMCGSGNIDPKIETSIVDQLFSLTMHNSAYELPEGDILISRNVDVGMFDFDNPAEVINLGYEDTMLHADSITSRLTTRWDADTYKKRREAFKAKCAPLVFESYQVNGLDEDQKRYVYDFMTIRRRNHNVLQREMGFEELRSNIFSVLTSGDFESEFPQITFNPETGKYDYAINLSTKPSLKLSLGGNLSSTPFNQIYLGVNYRKITTVSKSLFTELYLGPVYNCGFLGGRIDMFMKVPLFIEGYYSFVSKNLSHGDFGELSKVNNTLQVKSLDHLVSLGVGAPLTHRMMFSLRSNLGITNQQYDTQEITLPSNITLPIDRTTFKYWASKAEMEHSTLNKPLFPTDGSRLTLSGLLTLGSERSYAEESYEGVTPTSLDKDRHHNWIGLKAVYEKYFNISSWLSWGMRLDGVYTNVEDFQTQTATSMILPSYEPVLHSKMVFMPEFSARRYVATGVAPTIKMLNNLYIQAGCYALARDIYRDEDIDVRTTIEDKYSLHFVSDIAFIYQSKLGFLSLEYTKYNLHNWDNMYLTLNFGYSIFAPKGTFY